MDALELMHNRVSSPLLGDQLPTDQQLQAMFKAALRAPDHAGLHPWRFLTVAGNDRAKLGELFLAAAQSDSAELSDAKQSKLQRMPLRAPMLVVVIACTQDHPKVPLIEQQISAGVAAQNLLLAAFAQNIGGIWRTGDMAYHPVVEQGLGLEAGEQIVGYLYLGSQPDRLRKVNPLDPADFVQAWPQA